MIVLSLLLCLKKRVLGLRVEAQFRCWPSMSSGGFIMRDGNGKGEGGKGRAVIRVVAVIRGGLLVVEVYYTIRVTKTSTLDGERGV